MEQRLGGLTHRSTLDVWVGCDEFGRSQGRAFIQCSSSSETRRVIETIDGCVLNGRSLAAKEESAEGRPPLAGLPEFRPAWLRRVTQRMGKPADDDPAANRYNDSGRAW